MVDVRVSIGCSAPSPCLAHRLRIAVSASLSSIALLHRLYGAGSIALGCEKKMLSPAERLALVGGCARHGASYASRARVRHVCRAQRAAASRAVLRAVSDALLYRCSRRHAAHERTPFAFGWSPSARAGTAVTEQSLFFCGRKDGKLVALRHMVREGLRPPVLFFVQSVERAMQPFFVLVYVYNVPGAQSEAKKSFDVWGIELRLKTQDHTAPRNSNSRSHSTS